jgi:hypothetical protein
MEKMMKKVFILMALTFALILTVAASSLVVKPRHKGHVNKIKGPGDACWLCVNAPCPPNKFWYFPVCPMVDFPGSE